MGTGADIEYVAGFYFNGAHVALVSKVKPAWMAGKLNAIGGKIEPGELPRAAMRREFCEEAGTDVPEERWCLFLTLEGRQPDGRTFRVYFYRADHESYDLPPKTMTKEEVGMYPYLGGLNVMPNLRWILPMADLLQRHDWPFLVRERTVP